jgi:uncharacterized protein
VQFLTRPAAWGDDLPVTTIETHLSWVFECGDDVYKLKKPLLFGRQDLRGLPARRHNCELELRLNHRFAPDVYLGCVPVCRTSDGLLHVGPPGEIVDWLVHMRRLPADRFLDQRIAARDVDHRLVRQALGPLVAHLCSSPPVVTDPTSYVAGLDAALTVAEIDLRIPDRDPTDVAAVVSRLRRWVASHKGPLGRRVRERRIVEGHGDLRPEHICLTQPPAIIDCLEFDLALRTLDGLDELGFLALECEQLGDHAVAKTVLDVWRDVDDVPPELLAFHQALRALRRASVAAMRLRERSHADPRAQWARMDRYLAAATQRAKHLEAS